MATRQEPIKIGNYWTNLVDSVTGESVNFEEVTTWWDGTPMDDSKADGYLFRKLPLSVGGGYVRRVTDGGEFNVKWAGAKGDGITDDTAAINLAISFSKDVYIPEGYYMINGLHTILGQWGGGIRLRNGSNVKIHPNATLKVIPNNSQRYSLFDAYKIKGAKVTGGTLLGERNEHTGTGGEWGHGFNIVQSEDIVIKDCIIKDFWGDGIYIGGRDGTSPSEPTESEDDVVPSKNVYIDNVTISNCRRQGMSLTCVDGLVCENTLIELTNGAMPQALVDIEPNRRASTFPTQDRYGYARNITFKGCTFRGGATQGILMVHLDELSEDAISHVTIEGNTFYGNQSTNLVVRRASNVVVNNNIFKPSIDQGNGGQVALSGKNVLFTNNIVEKAQEGNYLIRYFKESWPVDLTVTNNILISESTSTPVLNRIEGADIQFIFKGNSVVGTWGQIVSMATNSALEGAVIDSNSFNGVFSDVFQLASSSTYTNCAVTNNRFGPGLQRCLISSNNTNFILKGNIFTGQTTRLISVEGATSGIIDGNQFIETTGAETIIMQHTSGLVVQNNYFKNCDNSVAVIYGGGSNTDCRISNNTVIGNTYSGTGIFAVGPTYIIINNTVSGYTTGLDTSSSLATNLNNTVDGAPMVAGSLRPGFVYRGAAVPNGSSIDTLLASLRDAGIIAT